MGFGSGAATFQRIARVMGGINIPVHGEEGEMSADRIVRAWRTQYADIVAGWKACGKALGITSMIIWTWPAIRSVMAGPPPR